MWRDLWTSDINKIIKKQKQAINKNIYTYNKQTKGSDVQRCTNTTKSEAFTTSSVWAVLHARKFLSLEYSLQQWNLVGCLANWTSKMMSTLSGSTNGRQVSGGRVWREIITVK